MYIYINVISRYNKFRFREEFNRVSDFLVEQLHSFQSFISSRKSFSIGYNLKVFRGSIMERDRRSCSRGLS